MTSRQPRLARLLDIRRIQLRLAARDLTRAARAAAASVGMAVRITELYADMTIERGGILGYDTKAAAATRAALAAAGTQQVIRVAEAEARRAQVASDVHRQRAAADAVARTIDRAASAKFCS